ncbi:MAG: beta-lactamase family protein [Anaerolineales bacterium]|nr:beta-lactamase family protein [Anaerolineales bacterium]
MQVNLDEIVHRGAISAQGYVTIGGEVFMAASGVADISSREPAPLNGYYRIGSTTKTFVATVVLQLVDEGKLSLDDPLARHLPNLVTGNGYDDTAITVRHLLQHTSGIYDYNMDADWTPFEDQALFEARRFQQYGPVELLGIALGHRPKFLPGTAYSYANTNYIVVGLLIEAITGNHWSTEVEQRIIQPLNLAHTFIPIDVQLPEPHAKGYFQFEQHGMLVDVTDMDMSAGGAGGAIVSNLVDIAHFFTALLGGELLSAEQLAEMQATVPSGDERYGLGLGWTPLTCGGGYWRHGGAVPGYLSYEAFKNDSSVGVVLSVTGWGFDSANFASDDAARKLIDNVSCDRK